jgi:hypothetical protein
MVMQMKRTKFNCNVETFATSSLDEGVNSN